jgi:hypothetical protein
MMFEAGMGAIANSAEPFQLLALSPFHAIAVHSGPKNHLFQYASLSVLLRTHFIKLVVTAPAHSDLERIK